MRLKRSGKNAQKNYKNVHNDRDRDVSGVTHIKILEYEVKWALGRITTRNAMEGDEIPAELLKIPKE